MLKYFRITRGLCDCISAERDSDVFLFSDKRSSCSWRVRIALNLKEIPYQIIPSDLEAQPSFDERYAYLNPMSHVPALRIDNHTLIGSLNILEYLEETRRRRRLLSADSVKRARVREICDIIASGIQPLQNRLVLNYVGEQRRHEWAQRWIIRGLGAVETLLERCSGMFCVGDKISLADCCLVPQLYNARLYGVDVDWFPIALRVEGNLMNRPAFTLAHPNNHPEYVVQAI